MRPLALVLLSCLVACGCNTYASASSNVVIYQTRDLTVRRMCDGDTLVFVASTPHGVSVTANVGGCAHGKE